MKSPSEKLFLLDIDDKYDSGFLDNLCSHIEGLGAVVILQHETVKGHHIVTTGFNPGLFKYDIDIKRNAMVFHCSQEEVDL